MMNFEQPAAEREPPPLAVKPTSRAQTNGGFGARSGPSRGDLRRRAFRPFETFVRPGPNAPTLNNVEGF